MSSITERFSATSYGPSITLTSVGAWIVRRLVELQRRNELDRSRKLLAELDDRLLRDIGIDRATAKHEATKGFWH